MGKRAAVAVAAGSPTRAAKGKAARVSSPRKSVAEEPKTPAEQLAEKLHGLLSELFAEEAGGGEATADMLCVALPFAVAPAKDHRHINQVVIIDSISTALARAERQRQTAVDAAEADIKNHAASREATAGKLETAKSEAAASKDRKEQKSAAEKAAIEVVTAITAQLDDLREKLDGHGGQQGKVEAEKAEYEALHADGWTKLKAGEFDKKLWRERNKLVTHVMKMLGKANLPASLGASLDVVLKTRPEERGPFAGKSLEHGEALFATHLASLATAIAECGKSIDECKAATEAEEKKLSDANARKSKAEDELIEADNAWAAAETQVYEIGEVLKTGEPRAQELDGEREEKHEILSSLQHLKTSWEALVDPPPPSVIAVDEEEPDEHPHAASEACLPVSEPAE